MNKLNEQVEFEQLLEYGHSLSKTKNYSTAKAIFEQCLLLPETQSDKLKQMDAYLSLSFNSFRSNNYPSAIPNFAKALEICEQYLHDAKPTEKIKFCRYVSIKLG